MHYDEEVLREWKEDIKQADMYELIDELDILRDGKGSFLCPNPEHNDHNLGSCHVMGDGHRFKCYACGAYGDNISLMQMYAKKYEDADLNMIQAGDRIAEIMGLRTSQSIGGLAASGPKRPFTKKQMRLLGLSGEGSFLDIKKAFEYKVSRERCLFDAGSNLYLYGDIVKESMDNLYDEDRETFEAIVVPRLERKLADLMVNYEDHDYEGLMASDEHGGYIPMKDKMESDIEELISLAWKLRPVAKKYGRDLSFIEKYKKIENKPKPLYEDFVFFD